MLFYRLLSDHLDETLPIIYTPTVGLACQQYSHIYRRPRGLFLAYRDRGQIAQRLHNFSRGAIRLIVVTNSERILGLGDQGRRHGDSHRQARLVLRGRRHPSFPHPANALDVGTDNECAGRTRYTSASGTTGSTAPSYDSFVDRVRPRGSTRFPGALLQWEDFKKANALPLLERYPGRLPQLQRRHPGNFGRRPGRDIRGGSGHRVAAARAVGGDAWRRVGGHRGLRPGRAVDGGRRPVREGRPRQDLRGLHQRPAHHGPLRT